MCTLILIKVNNASYGFYKLSSCSFPLSCSPVLSLFYSIILVRDSLFTFYFLATMSGSVNNLNQIMVALQKLQEENEILRESL